MSLQTEILSPVEVDTSAKRPKKLTFKQSAAVGIGNFMEWFDFAIYGYFAAVIGQVFFPSNAPGISLLSSLAVFAVGFLARPFGALVLGPLGDKLGRKYVLMVTVFGMGVFTTLMGLLPGYATLGLLAPIVLILLRFLQGMMVGGEWSSAGIFLIESADDDRRARAASLITCTAGIAFLAGTATAAAINSGLSEEQVVAWGWRIPFVLSIFMTLLAVFIRRRLDDTPVYHELQAKKASNAIAPISFAKKRSSFIIAFAFSALFGVSLYYFITYANTHLVTVVQLPKITALWLCSLALLVYCFMHPFVGLLIDKVGRRKPVLFTAAGLIISAYPIFLMWNTGNSVRIVLASILLGFFVCLSAVLNVVLLVEVFPASIRSTGAALGHNIASAVLAGPGPFIAALLIQYTGNPNVPAWYLIGVATFCFLILFFMLPETKGKNLSDEH